MEINIPSRRRDHIQRQIAEFREVLGRSDSGSALGDHALATKQLDAASLHQATNQLGTLMNAYSEAYTDIVRLLARDCWPRFKASRFYKEVMCLYSAESSMIQMTIDTLSLACSVQQNGCSGATTGRCCAWHGQKLTTTKKL